MTDAEPRPSLHLTAQPLTLSVQMSRVGAVPETMWLQIIAEWGATQRGTVHTVSIPVERFLARRQWLVQQCRRHGVDVQLDEHVLELVEVARAERTHLERSLSTDASGSESDAIDRLGETRFERSLRDFQTRDLAKLLSLQHGANFSVPGAGKTAVTYALYEAERAASRVAQLLVVAPKSAFETWHVEAERCMRPAPLVSVYGGTSPDRDAEVLLVGYQRLLYSYDEIVQWVARMPTHLVLDEAHRMKRGWSGEWGRTCLSLAYRAARRDVLTGTPAPHHPRDLEAVLDFVWPNQGRRLLPAAALDREPTPEAVHEVAQRIGPLFVRTTKSELGLPPVFFDVRQVPLEGLQAEIYAALSRRYAGQYATTRADQVSLARMGQVAMYLIEAATNPALLVAGGSRDDPIEFRHPPLDVEAGSALAELLMVYPQHEVPRKFVELARLVRDNTAQGEKTLVWSNFVRNLVTLANRELQPFEPALIHGGVPMEEDGTGAARTRQTELERFRNDPHCSVLLANPAAVGEGISLHEVCHHAVYLDRTFNAGQYLQSLDRIHRLGLPPTQSTYVTFLMTENTVDEVVDQRVATKAERLAHMLDDHDLLTMALPDEEDYGYAIEGLDDIAALFAHLRQADA
ncbi:MAG: DEAD/DEAH box helicase [Acidimicrobiia bacterium]